MKVEELAPAQIANGSSRACRSNADIETRPTTASKNLWAASGILIFADGSSAYSVRQVDQNLPQRSSAPMSV